MRPNSSNGRKAVLIDGCRIPFLRSGTGYHDLTSYDLGRLVLKALLDRTQLPTEKIDQVIMGTVISNMATSNVARESALLRNYLDRGATLRGILATFAVSDYVARDPDIDAVVVDERAVIGVLSLLRQRRGVTDTRV